MRKIKKKDELIEYCANCLSRLIRKRKNGWEMVVCPKCGVRWKGRIEDEKG